MMQALNMKCVVLIVFILGILVSSGACEGPRKTYSNNAIARSFDVEAFFRYGKQFVGGIITNDLGAKIIMNCIRKTLCFYSNYDDPDRNMKCSMYIIKCIYKQLADKGTCLYDLAVDTAIDLHCNGLNFHKYDHVTILLDVIACAGVDTWTKNYLQEMLKN